MGALADTSAWTTRHRSPPSAASFDAAAVGGAIAICEIVMLELLRTARDAADLAVMREELESLPQVHIGRRTWRRAIDVHELLGLRGPLHHRSIPWPDFVIAAAAELADLPLLHYDRDFETIAQLTGQPVEAIAPLGSL